MISNDTPGAFQQPHTLIEMLRAHVERRPDKIALTFLAEAEGSAYGQEEIAVTYAGLDRRARAIGADLQSRAKDGASVAGQRALLLFPPGLDFIAAFFGCLYAGVVAVPAYPPRLNRPSPRIAGIAADAQASLALTTGKIFEGLKKRFHHAPDLAALDWFDLETIGSDRAGEWREPPVTGQNLAFLQYTSGSTGTPKGVMLNHDSVLANLEVIRSGFQIDHTARGAFWLPSFHDMGLIGGILEPIYIGASTVLMAPAAFLQRPVRWLEMISRFQATVSGAPNFAYKMCVDKVTEEQRQALDLSSWQVAFCGAEPIRRETLAAFADTFAAHGFRRQSFYPCYGLAESALLVAGGDGPGEPVVAHVDSAALAQGEGVAVEENGAETTTLVGCGTARPGHRLVIADPELMTPCEDGEIGEIWAAGPSVASGYWRCEEETEKTFRARLAQSGDGPFLRTGDLGFLRDGQLYVTGRLKDLIIIRGRNYYPHDIEYTVAESHDALEMDTGAAFSVDVDGEEKLVVVHEMKRERRKTPVEAILPAVRGAVAREHQIQLHALVLIRPLSMPRTSSGKVKRRRCREMYLNGELKVLGEWRDNGKRKTDNGKRETKQGELGTENWERDDSAFGIPHSEISDWLVMRVANMLGLAPGEVDMGRPVVDFGLDSVQAVELVADLEDWLGLSLAPTLVWDYPTIEALARYLAENIKQKTERPKGTIDRKQETGNGERGTGNEVIPNSAIHNRQLNEPVAVVGIGCRFPGADGPEAFWRLLQDGRDLIDEAPADRWPVDTYFSDGPEPAQGKMNTRWGGFLEGVDQFDADFFGIAPREAARMDPQQRLLLEVAWEALENAGIDPTSLAGSATGVFMGISSYDYSRLQFSRPDLIDAYAGTGNAHSIAANRLSYFLDLRGPSMAVDTACSSSLVATHMAMQSLRQGETDAALVGGVNLILSPELTITFSQARMMAADGRCKTFDAAADGYVRGEGCGILVLKRLSDAQRDGDPVLALLRGSAVNQDGRSNGLTAPNGLAQQAVIRRALSGAGVNASEIDVIEAHGTGTKLGDPIEVRALQAVFDGDTAAPGSPLWVGSVKTNAGHLEAAAGAAGLIKTILALVHEALPPHLHLHTLNPHINLKGSRLIIDGQGRAWPRSERPRLAGVSSFGFGGTNAHVIVEEAPLRNAESGMRSGEWGMGNGESVAQVLMLSAKDDRALREMALRYADFLAAHPAVSLADVCYTADKGRARFEKRLAVVADTVEEMREALREGAANIADSTLPQGHPARIPHSVAFLFTGQGAQYAGMGRRLYETEAVFREALDRCALILESIQGTDDLRGDFPGNFKFPGKWWLLDVLFAAESDSPIDETQYTQPALFVLEYALAQLWRSWGVEPDVVIGHSVGEYAAACVAGVMSLEDGLRLISARGRLMGRLPLGEGSMAAVFAPEAQVRASIASLADEVTVAAVNGPTHTVISGEAAAVAKAVEALAAAGLETRPLTVSHAFHSPLMDPILDAFEAAAAQCRFQAPRIPFVSNLTGDFMTAAPDARYWREHVRRAVQFEAGMQRIAEMDAGMALLEIGPQPHLTGMARRMQRISDFGFRISDDVSPGHFPLGDADSSALLGTGLASMRRGQDERRVMLESAGRLFEMGFEPSLFGGKDSHSDYGGYRIHLPTYPFQRQRYWLETGEDAPGAGSGFAAQAPGEWVERRREGTEADGPRRLATAVPLFESWVDFAAGGDQAALLREQAAAVAGLFWGDGAHEIGTFEVDEEQVRRLAGSDSGAPLRRLKVQTTLDEIDEQTASVQIFGQDGVDGSWVPLARGELGRVERKTENIEHDTENQRPGMENWELDLGNGDALRAYLQEALAAVLGLGGRQVPGNRPLDSLGLDSLMALELKNRFEMELGLDLPVVSLLQGPTLSELAEMLAGMAGDEGTAVAPLFTPQTEIGQPAPLSYGQQAMWLLHQLLPADVALNVAGAARLVGAVNADALERALGRLVEKHGALRTVFAVSDEAGSAGHPVQIVQEAMAVPLVRVDAAAWENAAVDAYLQREAYQPFDLQNGPLLRLVLLKRGGDEHDLLLAINHLITDFWSMSLLVRDLYGFYEAELRSGGAAEWDTSAIPNPKSQIEVADYARWQMGMLESEEGATHREYWLQKLAGELPRLDLPADRPRPAIQTYDGDSAVRRIGPALTEKLKQLSQEQGVTLATTLLAAFQTLLHRYTGQDDLLVGSVIAGREHPALQELLGYLINPVALRADFAGRPSFVRFLAQARETMLQAMAHQDYPLARVAQDLAGEGRLTLDPSRPPLFETMFIMQRAQVMAEQGLSAFALGVPGAALQLDGLTIESRPLAGLPAQFDLTLMAAEVGEGLAIAFHYNTHLFDASTMARMLAHLETLLEGIAADPQRPVNEIPLLPVDEQRRQLLSWNETAVDFARDKRLHELVAEQSARTPQKTAVTCEGESLTYAELEQDAEALAERLRELGVGPGSLVALQVERSTAMVTGLLGILKTGAAYIPIDPDFPDERIRLMLEDARPVGVLTENGERKTGNGELGTGNWELETGDWERDSEDCSLDSENCPLAYVIYTSGSTGRPKGVQISHHAVVNFLTSMQREPGLSADDRLLAVTTLSFDIAVLELFLPLISGAEVVIATRETAVDGAQLAQLLDEAKITMMQATPATWRLLLESGWRGKEDLTILCGGEALRPGVAQELLPRCKALWNMYGPTETTVWSTIARIETAEAPIPIGRPIANTRVYLLDDNLQPVPVGAVGQLYIAGDGVARGYLNRPELTAERFVADPFVSSDQYLVDSEQCSVESSLNSDHYLLNTMYRTGDLGRYLADGTLLHLGRDDFQVKVRGFRIELGEIETAVNRHPAVAGSVTVAREAAGGDVQLVTYWTVAAGAEMVDAGELRDFLRTYLPGYMIPAHFVLLDALPTTPNGKLDRRALPQPPSTREGSQAPYAAPRSELEEELAALCAEVLGLERVGIFDNFFDLGGSSLAASRLVFQVRERFEAQIPLRQLFQEPTVAGLSRAISAARLGRRNGSRNGHALEGTLSFTASDVDLRAEAERLIAEFGMRNAELARIPHYPEGTQSTLRTPHSILLTGATGFLGAYLLRDLLCETTATVTCLVRAENGADAMARIQGNMAGYGLWDERFAARIVALPGDLGEPLLGLSPEQFAELGAGLDAVYHNGAMVNFVHPYRRHRAVNVLGTREILRLADQGSSATPVHFVSTLSVFHDGGEHGGTVFREDADLDAVKMPFGGYAQSKWVAEKLVMAAMAQGAPAAIYRPGLISGDSVNGAWNTADMMTTMALACAATGTAPDLDVMVDIVPVDYVSRAIVALAGRPESLGSAFHLSNPRPVPYDDLLGWTHGAGLPLQVVPFDSWRAGIVALAAQLGGENWNPFLPLLEEVTADQIFMPAIDCRNTLAGLAAAAEEEDGELIRCPRIDARLLETYIAFLRRQGLLSFSGAAG